MKISAFLFIILICALKLYSQGRDNLFGSYRNGNEEIFSSLDILGKIFMDLDTLDGVQTLIQGESAFDAGNKRYFNRTNLGIMVIDALTGAIVDIIANPVGMKGIEYDRKSNRLLGSYWNGNVEIFTSLDICTKTFIDLDTLKGVMFLTQGESTFDEINNRYFNKTNLGITIINALTGAIIDTVAHPWRMLSMGMKGIEYDRKSNRLIGSYWNGNVEIFTSLEISTKIYIDLATLDGVYTLIQGESTFDAGSTRYFNKTNLGITVIDALTGSIIDKIVHPANMPTGMKGIEYNASLPLTGDAGENKTICRGDSLRIGITQLTGKNYVWLPSTGLSNSNIAEPFAFPKATTTYTLTVTDTTSTFMCDQTTFNITITVEACHSLIPNVFTPNGDGINDVFKIDNLSEGSSVIIYNRWGIKVFDASTPLGMTGLVEWDGRTTTGIECPEGVYYYLLLLTDSQSYKGFVELKR